MTEQPLQLLINETQERCESESNKAFQAIFDSIPEYNVVNLKYRTNTKEPFQVSNATNHWNTPA